jgi:hypothetical protein
MKETQNIKSQSQQERVDEEKTLLQMQEDRT